MIVLVVTAPADEVELAADMLWSLGVVAVEERPGPSGECELWTSLGDDLVAAEAALAELSVRWAWRWEEVDAAVADSWRQFAQSVQVDDDLVVCPAWVTAPSSDGMVIRIEPGATFGLGDHPTTRLSLLALRHCLAARPGATVLDVGCGSGVLAVAAALFGAGEIVAVDITPAAVPTTLDNAVRNGVAGRIDVSTTPLAEVDGVFDVVVANILAPTLVELAPDLMRVAAPGGLLVLSGVLADRFDHVVASLAPFGVVSVDVLDGWAAVTLSR